MGLILPLTWNNDTQGPPIGRIEIYEPDFLEKLKLAWADGSEFCLGGWVQQKPDGTLGWKMLSIFPKPAVPAVPGTTKVELVVVHTTAFE